MADFYENGVQTPIVRYDKWPNTGGNLQDIKNKLVRKLNFFYATYLKTHLVHYIVIDIGVSADVRARGVFGSDSA